MIYHFCYTEFEKMLGQMSQLAATYLIGTLSKYFKYYSLVVPEWLITARNEVGARLYFDRRL